MTRDNPHFYIGVGFVLGFVGVLLVTHWLLALPYVD